MEFNSLQLNSSNNRFAMLTRATDKTSCCNLDNGDMLREVTVKIGLERIDTQEGIMVEVLLDSRVTGLVMSSEFARKQGFKLKKLDRPMYVKNVDGLLNKERLIEYIIKIARSGLSFFFFSFLFSFRLIFHFHYF